MQEAGKPDVNSPGAWARLLPGLLSILLLLMVSVPSARAHSLGAQNHSGLPVPNLTHGQMAVIADHRSAILAVASRQSITDETFRRLLNYANIQYSYCLWGIVPGSVEDENSPFNHCSHAYLAALKALLLHLTEDGNNQAAVTLAGAIELDMLRRNASLALCVHSGGSFNTAEVVPPAWADVFTHPPSLVLFGGVLLASSCAGAAMLRLGRSRKN